MNIRLYLKMTMDISADWRYSEIKGNPKNKNFSLTKNLEDISQK